MMKSDIQIANELRNEGMQLLQNAFQAANDDEKKMLAKQSLEKLQGAFVTSGENPTILNDMALACIFSEDYEQSIGYSVKSLNSKKSQGDTEEKIAKNLEERLNSSLRNIKIAIENPYSKFSKIHQEAIQDGKVVCPEKLEQCKEILQRVGNLYSKGLSATTSASAINNKHYSPDIKSKMDSMFREFNTKAATNLNYINLINKDIESNKGILSSSIEQNAEAQLPSAIEQDEKMKVSGEMNQNTDSDI